MDMSGEHSPLSQMQREQILAERNAMALMQSGMNNTALTETRPKHEDESVFLTPRSSPYSDGAGYDMSYFEPRELVDLEQHSGLQPAVSTSPYMSPCEEPYIDYHHGSPPYSPPYDNSPISANGVVCSDNCSSPGSCTSGSVHPYPDLCSPVTIPCTGPDHFSTFMTAPMSTIPSTTCTPMPFSSGCCSEQMKNTQVTYTPASYQPWGDMMYPPNNFSHPSVNIEHSEIISGETPINIVDRQFSCSPDIIYYPPSPQNATTLIQGANYPHRNITFNEIAIPMHHQYPMPPKSEKSVRVRKTPKTRKPPIEVDDSEIKDIPTSAQLWEFTLRVLKKPKYSNMVSWENQKEGLFRFHDAQAFAALWGKHRNRPNMTYDKVARALRYYYKRNIFTQVGGRLTYRFSDRLRKLYQNEE